MVARRVCFRGLGQNGCTRAPVDSYELSQFITFFAGYHDAGCILIWIACSPSCYGFRPHDVRKRHFMQIPFPASPPTSTRLYGTTTLLSVVGGPVVEVFCSSARGLDEILAFHEDWKEHSRVSEEYRAEEKDLSPWCIMSTAVNIYPRLKEERRVSPFYHPVMKLLEPGFRDVRTEGSLGDERSSLDSQPFHGHVVPSGKNEALLVKAGYILSFTRDCDFDDVAFTIGWKQQVLDPSWIGQSWQYEREPA